MAGDLPERLREPLPGDRFPHASAQPGQARRARQDQECRLVPAEGAEFDYLSAEITDSDALLQPRGLILDGACVSPAALELPQLGVAHAVLDSTAPARSDLTPQDPRWSTRTSYATDRAQFTTSPRR